MQESRSVLENLGKSALQTKKIKRKEERSEHFGEGTTTRNPAMRKPT